jgi:hypothetical protein
MIKLSDFDQDKANNILDIKTINNKIYTLNNNQLSLYTID